MVLGGTESNRILQAVRNPPRSAFLHIAKHQWALNLQGQSELQIDLDLLMHLLNLKSSQF